MSKNTSLMVKHGVPAVVSGLGLLLTACASSPEAAQSQAYSKLSADTHFVEVFDVIPFEDRKRRKFDNAVIADLDQDGRQDVIINEHGRHMKVFWNDGKTFSKGPVIAKGDVHGAAVADFDQSDKIDVIITQGGGDGANPRRPLWVEIDKDRNVERGTAFEYFEPGRGRAAKFMSSPVDKALNLLVTGFATPAQMKIGANHYYDHIGEGKFKFQENLPNADRLGFRATVTDFNSDDIEDVLFFGAGHVVAAQGLPGGTFKDVTDEVFGPVSKIKDVHAITEIDYDNDGDFDLFLTRAEFQFDIENYYNAAENKFAFITFRKDFLFEDLKIEGDLILENLQRTYPHYNLYMGANKTPYGFEGDPHGHQDITIKPKNAQGWPEGELKGGLYVGYLGDGMWRMAGQTQSRWAGVVNNVISTPTIEAQPDLPAFMLENRSGRFVDVTTQLGFNIKEQTTGVTAGDFNNDGWQDLAILRYGSMAEVNEHMLYLNDMGTTFNRTEEHGIKADEFGTTGGFINKFDYDLDGKLDIIYSNERGRWHLLSNEMGDAGSNNYVVLDVAKLSWTDGSPLGSTIELSACGMTQKQKVGASSSAYSQDFNTILNFGLGACNHIDGITLGIPGHKKRVLKQDEISKVMLRKKLR